MWLLINQPTNQAVYFYIYSLHCMMCFIHSIKNQRDHRVGQVFRGKSFCLVHPSICPFRNWNNVESFSRERQTSSHFICVMSPIPFQPFCLVTTQWYRTIRWFCGDFPPRIVGITCQIWCPLRHKDYLFWEKWKIIYTVLGSHLSCVAELFGKRVLSRASF